MIRIGLVCLLLAGCAAKPIVVTKIRLVEPNIPQALLMCPASPMVPDAVRQSQIADYIAALWRAHAICYDHLAAVRQNLQSSRKPGLPRSVAGFAIR